MEHREALVFFSMHIVSTLLSRLLFLTICIFNVNIYSIYQVFFVVLRWRESQVSYQGCSLLKVSRLPEGVRFLIFLDK